MSSSIKATRMELLRLKKKKSLALKGHKLLKEKRDALISEFFKLIDDLEKSMSDTESSLSKAYKSLVMSQAISGYEEVRLASDSNDPRLSVSASHRTIMGVKVPTFQAESLPTGRGYSLISPSLELDQAASDFEDTLKTVVKLAELEATAKSLAEEIKKTKRKVNSLERIVTPRIESDIAAISMRLEEMERENFARLKVIKGNMAE